MFVEIPANSLSQEALHGVVEEFVTREGTDYGHGDHSLEQKMQAVFRQLERGDVAIVFDPESETCNIVTRESIRDQQSST
jgi:uncharacterized protein YheU (UPF0270 family)